MAKGIGLIGNFRGKVGNMVGYNLKDSNNKQTQGVRVYQPIVKNPKTYAQAEQRAKLAPINATYRMLKPFIDRGQETKAYGNKSRLAWLKQALKDFNGGWFEKGTTILAPARCQLTKGSLVIPMSYDYDSDEEGMTFALEITGEAPTTYGGLSTALLAQYPALKAGDQITFGIIKGGSRAINCQPQSFVIDTTSTVALPSTIYFSDGTLVLQTNGYGAGVGGFLVLSREGDNGEHLRSNSSIILSDLAERGEYFTPEGKDKAVRSYMGASATTDWPEEPVQG